MENEELINKLYEEIKILNKHQDNISKALQVLARNEIESRLKHIFKNENEILVYQLSDGRNTTTEIEKYVPMSSRTISRLWEKWERELGIVETEGYRNPYRAKYSVVELALLFGKKEEIEISQVSKEVQE